MGKEQGIGYIKKLAVFLMVTTKVWKLQSTLIQLLHTLIFIWMRGYLIKDEHGDKTHN